LIFGIGIDTIEVPRIARQLSEDDRFKHRVFTEREIAYCEAKKFGEQYFAARFAAKEALLKALGTGLRGPMKWTDIEVVHDELGRPSIELAGGVGKWVGEYGISRIHVSLSHVKEVASAIVIAEK
jgi:holo-[acyl-carrier protein] synthase